MVGSYVVFGLGLFLFSSETVADYVPPFVMGLSFIFHLQSEVYRLREELDNLKKKVR
jgi:hypothetical protein